MFLKHNSKWSKYYRSENNGSTSEHFESEYERFFMLTQRHFCIVLLTTKNALIVYYY